MGVMDAFLSATAEFHRLALVTRNVSHFPMLKAVVNPWVFIGIFFLLAFMAAYLTALSWADLTYVLPATAFGYVFIALIAKFFLHEHISALRWLGILLISAGVGFVAGGPESSSTKQIPEDEHAEAALGAEVKAARIEPWGSKP